MTADRDSHDEFVETMDVETIDAYPDADCNCTPPDNPSVMGACACPVHGMKALQAEIEHLRHAMQDADKMADDPVAARAILRAALGHNHDAVGLYPNCPGCGTVIKIAKEGT